MKKAMLLIAATALWACGAQGPEDEYSSAVPTAKELALSMPGANGDGPAALTQPTEAHLYRVTRDTASVVNAHVSLILNRIENTVRFHKPTFAANNKAVWGPYTPPLSRVTWMLAVEKKAPGKYHYLLGARAKTDPNGQFKPVLAGESVKGQSPVFSGFTGGFLADSDVLHAIDPISHPDTGKAAVTYDTTGLDRDVKIVTSDATVSGAPVLDFAYSYLDRVDASGEFGLITLADVQEDGSAAETVLMKTVWGASGEGHGAAVVTGGDIPNNTKVIIAECWDANFMQTYYQDSHGINPTVGDPQACIPNDGPNS